MHHRFRIKVLELFYAIFMSSYIPSDIDPLDSREPSNSSSKRHKTNLKGALKARGKRDVYHKIAVLLIK